VIFAFFLIRFFPHLFKLLLALDYG
jgi:hypothetical protein